ncbi:MAG: hypothetical protein J0H12_02620 [Candidatus Paracaedimonas acanthamoebae]|uniref:Leucine-rich repeat domain-containing protein n=1 Tax=Candidatus Paracaedimonas acanthamoebae TaxID=244581 RepID=A0A8J7PLS2_9PROT|nr:hypothetical protein [Candidatus Paracaedimonas acanthamoebae]
MMKKVVQTLCTLLLSTTIACASDQQDENHNLTHLKAISNGTLHDKSSSWQGKLEDLAPYKNLQNLSVENLDKSHMNTFNQILSNLSSLQELELGELTNATDNDTVSLVRALPNTLQKLSLNMSHVSPLRAKETLAKSFRRFSQLKSLKLQTSGITDNNLINVFPTSLTKLDVDNGDMHFHYIFKELSTLSELQVLKLGHVGHVGGNFLLENLSSLPTLKEFHWNCSRWVIQNILEVIHTLPHTLQVLKLEYSYRTKPQEGIVDLIKWFPPHLQGLHLSHFVLNDNAMQALMAVSTNLTILSLRNNNIHNDGLQVLMSMFPKKFLNLQKLDLYENLFDEEIAQHLFTMLSSNTTLQDISLFEDTRNLKFEVPQENYTLQKLGGNYQLTKTTRQTLNNNVKRAVTLEDLASPKFFLAS